MTTIPRTAEDAVAQAPSPLAEGTQALNAIARIIPGRRQQLQQVLAQVGRRIAAGGPSPLDTIGTVHFARWVVLPDDADGGSLLFASNYDPPWDTYIEQFASDAAESFDAIYSNCEGWPAGGSTDIEAFKAFIRSRELPPDVYYRAYPTATVRDVKSALRLKQAWSALLDTLNE
ncbi:hypothetical protein [Modestobacter excelsi]|uniref:hypothetical protein n=1 Tax=Modestobacter excelsi TaxID=2213161 RepID=UPI00110CC7B0|nr:hypothetical protein [Modestobacter excelsi]